MRLLLPLIAMTGLAACDSVKGEALEMCEASLTRELRSPGSYQRVSKVVTADVERAFVSLTYDAANAFGTPVRGIKVCEYRVENGIIDTSVDLFQERVNAELWTAQKAADVATARVLGNSVP